MTARTVRRPGECWARGDWDHRCTELVLFRELKGYQASGRLGRLSSEQRDWAIQLQPITFDGDQIEGRKRLLFDVWTPDDWEPLIIPTLTAKQPAAAR